MALRPPVIPSISTFRSLRFATTFLNGVQPQNVRPQTFICARCLQRRRETRRHVSTTTDFKPYSLDPSPPPPRNADVPDTSIAGPSLQSYKLGQQHGDPGITKSISQSTPTSQDASSATISYREVEAQKSKPLNPTSEPPSTKSPPRPATSKLRPRKAAMNLTPQALTHLRALLNQPEPKMIRVGVKNRGCSGLAYHLEYVNKPGRFDETVEQDGVKVLVDSKALFSIIGSEMDWVEDKLEQRFVFRNPNIKEQCGCGESFMV